MIVRPEPGSLLFITQPDHAVLALALVDRFDGLAANTRRDDIRLAVREHDNGWRELDEELVFDAASGKAFDFITAPESLKQSVWPLGIDRLASESAYAAALVAAHALFVYAAHRDEEDWRAFFANQEARRDDLLERARTPRETLEADYRFLALADMMSLSFCHGWTEARQRFGYAARCEETTLVISPAVVPMSPFPIRVPARRIADRRYDSAGDLRTALDAAPPEWVAGYACGRAAA